MCLLQNLAYDADNTSSVWTVNVIEYKKKRERERKKEKIDEIIYQMLLFKLIATQSMTITFRIETKTRYISSYQ
jgi:hypothetical protein